MKFCLRKFQVTKKISQQSVLWASILLLLAYLFYFNEDFDFNFANLTGKNLFRVPLDQPEKFEKFPLKAVRGNKMYTIKSR